jgi:quinol monooxygenase YgiN
MRDLDASAVTVTTAMEAKPGREDALTRVLRTLAERVRSEEPGCLLYQPMRSRHHPSRFLLVERYRDEPSLRAHANSKHLREALAELMECLVAPPELAIYGDAGD